jgi:hypothetical protein
MLVDVKRNLAAGDIPRLAVHIAKRIAILNLTNQENVANNG